MTKKSDETSFQDEMKSIFHHFLRASIEANERTFFERWKFKFKDDTAVSCFKIIDAVV